MNFKIFLPVEDYTLTTNLKVEEVNRRLSQRIRPKRKLKDFFFGDNSNKPYEGYILINDFEMSRIIWYRNSFLPLIKGLIYSADGKTYIKVKMKILSWVLVPTVIVIGVLTVVSFVTYRIPNIFMFNRQFAFLFPLVSYLVIYFAFKIESRISTKFLEKLLEAEKIKS
jgi:hypothetical protein